jgi:adenosylcobinamide-GDP ribazoletransferase
VAAIAMCLAPIVGAGLGAALGLLLAGLRHWTTGFLAAALTLVAATIVTRALHLDGLADTADGLGSYRDRQRALDIMKRSDIGPFGVTAIGLTLIAQCAALTTVNHPVTALAIAYASGRLAATIACSRGIPAARPDGMGALVAGTVPRSVAAVAVLAVGAGAIAAGAVLAPLAAIIVTAILLWHTTRRLGGITGDVIGAAVELATTAALITLG